MFCLSIPSKDKAPEPRWREGLVLMRPRTSLITDKGPYGIIVANAVTLTGGSSLTLVAISRTAL